MPDSCESATSMPDWSVVAAAFSAIATGFAAFAAWKSPIEAAKLAEGLRRTAELANRRHDGKMQLFATLMQERAAIYSAEGVRALNLIDVVFADAHLVRNAWAELLASFEPAARMPVQTQQERLRNLLAAIASDIGLMAEINAADLARVYYPAALSEEQAIRDAQRQAGIRQIRQAALGPGANTGYAPGDLWPPRPE